MAFSVDPAAAAAAAPYLGRGLGGGSRGRRCGGRLGFACEWERIAADVSPHPFTRRNLKRQGVFSVTIALQKIGIKAQCERGLPGTGGSGTFLRGPGSWGAGPALAERPLRTCAAAVRCRGEPGPRPAPAAAPAAPFGSGSCALGWSVGQPAGGGGTKGGRPRSAPLCWGLPAVKGAIERRVPPRPAPPRTAPLRGQRARFVPAGPALPGGAQQMLACCYFTSFPKLLSAGSVRFPRKAK